MRLFSRSSRDRSLTAPVRWRATVLFAGLTSLAALLAYATDPPHWTGSFPAESPNIDCTTPCHVTHNDQGGALTSDASNVNLCQSCHNSSDTLTGRPIDNAHKAIPGQTGISHSFEVPAVNAQLGTQLPSHAEMSLRVMGGNIVCSTCHDQHDSTPAMGGSANIGASKKRKHVAGTGVMSSGGAFSGAESMWYAIKITTAGNETTSRFQFRTYTEAAGWTAYSSDTVPGTDIALTDGVTVTFGAGSYDFDEHWEFSVAWPFLRAKLDDGDNSSADKFCRDCHANFVWNPAQVISHTPGVKKGHPVGMVMGGGAYDRAAPLDGNGGAAGSDGNPSNELELDSGGRLQCLSCHAMHYADSNTQTVDEP